MISCTLNSTGCHHHGSVNVGASILIFLQRFWDQFAAMFLHVWGQLSTHSASNSTYPIHCNDTGMLNEYRLPNKQHKRELNDGEWGRVIFSPRNWLTLTAPPVACLATWRPLVTVGLTVAGLSSGVMCSLSLEAPLWMALPVNSAPFTRPQLSQDAPGSTTELHDSVTRLVTVFQIPVNSDTDNCGDPPQ